MQATYSEFLTYMAHCVILLLFVQVDYYLGLQAEKFIGNSVSTFTAFIILERQWMGCPAANYNGGSVPLSIFLPFYLDGT